MIFNYDDSELSNKVDALHKIYRTREELGLTGTPTLVQLIGAMPNGSVFVGSAAHFDTSGMAYAGECTNFTVIKHDQNRTYLIGCRSFASVNNLNSRFYYATYAYNEGDPYINGWFKVETAEYKAGDTIEFGTAILFTYAGNASKAYIQLPLSKKLPASLTITHNLTVGWVRSASPAIDARGTVTAVTRTANNVLNVEITANSGYSFTQYAAMATALSGTVTFA